MCVCVCDADYVCLCVHVSVDMHVCMYVCTHSHSGIYLVHTHNVYTLCSNSASILVCQKVLVIGRGSISVGVCL